MSEIPKRSLEIVDAEMSAPYSVSPTAVNTPAGPSRAPSPKADLEKGDLERGERSPKPDKADGAVRVRPAKSKMTEVDKVEYLTHQVESGEHKYHQLGWIQLVVVLIVEAIALGSLSLPA